MLIFIIIVEESRCAQLEMAIAQTVGCDRPNDFAVHKDVLTLIRRSVLDFNLKLAIQAAVAESLSIMGFDLESAGSFDLSIQLEALDIVIALIEEDTNNGYRRSRCRRYRALGENPPGFRPGHSRLMNCAVRRSSFSELPRH
jgi:hypothetical protein